MLREREVSMQRPRSLEGAQDGNQARPDAKLGMRVSSSELLNEGRDRIRLFFKLCLRVEV